MEKISRRLSVTLTSMFLRCLILLVVALAARVHSRRLEKRMIGGKPAEIEEFPWLVFVGTSRYVCNGAILSKHYVLTAAHCVTKPMDVLIIRAGTKNRSRGGSVHHLENVTRHADFFVDDRELGSKFDIAVVKVVEPFVYDKTRQPIKLVEPGHQPQVNASTVEAGFGVTEWGWTEEFFKLDFHVVDTKACNESYASWGGIAVGQFCASTADQAHNYGCNGDSGAPLVYNSTTGEKMVVGIDIYGGGCELDDTPSVYSDVGYLRNWIDQYVVYDSDEDKVSHGPQNPFKFDDLKRL